MATEKKILIIDDSSLIRLQVKHIVERYGFNVVELGNADDYLLSTWQYADIGLILLDINLPGTNGIALLKQMASNKSMVWPPVIMISGSSDKDIVRTAVMQGAVGYLVKPLDETELMQRIEQNFRSVESLNLPPKYATLIQKMKKIFEFGRYFKKIPMDLIEEATNECMQVINSEDIMKLLIVRESSISDYTFQHALNVGLLSGLIGKWVGVKEERLRELVLAGLLHDIGKTQISKEILDKPEALLATEMEMIKSHPALSYEMIKEEAFSKQLLLGVSQHHERMDGSGYPDKLLGKEISLEARIVAVADVFDATTSNKAYRQRSVPFMVLEELCKAMYAHLDPHICTIFLKHVKENLIGQLVHLSDGSRAKVAHFAGQGFAEPVLHMNNGHCVNLSDKMHVVGFVNKR